MTDHDHDHPHPHTHGGPATGLIPVLNVSSLPASFGWFAKWGWVKLWDYADEPGGTPNFGAVGSGPCEIFLCLDGQGGRGVAGSWLSILVEDVDSVHDVCVREGVDVIMPPRNEPWGMREMHLRHPDGHMFRVGHGH